MVYLKSIKTFAKEMSELNPLGADDFGKKCASNKGIILINSFTLILSCLCDEKWDFLVENVLGMLIDKIALNIFNSVLIDWDYYHIYTTFDRLSQGKVKQYRLFSGQPTPGVKKKLDKIKTLSEESWKIFENKLINKFWNRVLVYVPGYLWDFKRYA